MQENSQEIFDKAIVYKQDFQKQLKLKLWAEIISIIVVLMYVLIPYVQRLKVQTFLVLFPDSSMVEYQKSLVTIIYECIVTETGLSLSKIFDFDRSAIYMIAIVIWLCEIIVSSASKIVTTTNNLKKLDKYTVEAYDILQKREKRINSFTYGFDKSQNLFYCLLCAFVVFFTNYLSDTLKVNNGLSATFLIPLILTFVVVVLQMMSANWLAKIRKMIKAPTSNTPSKNVPKIKIDK